MRQISIIGRQIQDVRNKLEMTQIQFCKYLKDMTNGNVNLALTTLSAYENGRRIPPIDVLVAISRCTNTSLDVLCGTDFAKEYRNQTETEKDGAIKIAGYGKKISMNNLVHYHKQPVYVISKNFLFPSAWGLVDYDRNIIIFNDEAYPINSQMEFYEHLPIDATFASGNTLQPLTYKQMMNAEETFWIEMLNCHEFVKGHYNGWYKHNEDKTMLINIANSLTLQYAGIGVSYNAFRIPDAE